MYKLTTGVIAVILLAGCTDLRFQRSLAKSSPAVEVNCSDLPGYYEDFSLMDRDRRKQELILSTEAWLFDPEGCKQLRLALILSHPDNPDMDRKKALKLLTGLLDGENDINAEERQMARLLYDQLNQLQSQQRLSDVLKDELKQERVLSETRLERLTDLESQLEQLKNIEENINEMEQAIITPAATDNGPHEPAQNPAGR